MSAPRSRFAHGWGNDQYRDSLARLIDQPPPTTFRDVAGMTLAPVARASAKAARFIARHTCAAARASWAALRAAFTTYRESINANA